MRRFVVICALAGVAFLPPSVVLAAPSSVPAEQLCIRHGGELEYITESGTYHCRIGPEATFSESQLAEAERLCRLAYKGDFANPGSHSYHCFAL
jgi:hypothetical protein